MARVVMAGRTRLETESLGSDDCAAAVVQEGMVAGDESDEGGKPMRRFESLEIENKEKPPSVQQVARTDGM